MSEALNKDVRVIDALGRTVHSGTIQGKTHTLNTQELSNGSYTLILNGNQDVKHLKFMVQHYRKNCLWHQF